MSSVCLWEFHWTLFRTGNWKEKLATLATSMSGTYSIKKNRKGIIRETGDTVSPHVLFSALTYLKNVCQGRNVDFIINKSTHSYLFFHPALITILQVKLQSRYRSLWSHHILFMSYLKYLQVNNIHMKKKEEKKNEIIKYYAV